MEVRFVYMTVGDKNEARKIAEQLVVSKLAACVNILDNMNAFYMWNEQLRDDTEVVMIAKTTESRVSDLVAKVQSMHSDDCPCILALPVVGGHQPFIDWIDEEVK